MMKVFRRLVFVFVVLSFFNNVFASEIPDPVVSLKKITDEILISLRKNKSKIEKDPEQLTKIIDNKIIPHVNFEEISKWITGKKIWRSSSIIDKRDFREQLKLIIVKTYGTALNNYSDEKIIFYPLKPSQKIRKKMQISSKVFNNKTKKFVRIYFRVMYFNSEWKVYDLVVEGVSLLKGLQAQFSEMIRNEGLRVVIDKMKDNKLTFEEDKYFKPHSATL